MTAADEVAVKFIVTLQRDEDGMLVAECPAIPGCVSQGATEAEALASISEAIRECLEVRADRGMPLTVSVRVSVREVEIPVG